MTPERVEDIISTTITNYDEKGCNVISDLWRGRLGMSKDDVKGKVTPA